MKKVNHRFLLFFMFLMMSLMSQAQHMFFHLLPGFAAPFTWVGLGADANWTTSANWTNGGVPTAADVAIFDDTCISNCDPTINAAVSVRGFNIKSTYAGTITQSSAQTITIGNAGWIQGGGTFNGSDANVTFNGSVLTLSGTAIYNATSARTYFDLTQSASAVVLAVPAGTTLNFPVGSLQKFFVHSACAAPNYSFNSPQKISFYDLEMSVTGNGCGYAYFGNPTTAIEIRNDFNFLTNDYLLFVGTIEFYGNVTSQGYTTYAGYGNTDSWIAMGNVSKTYSGPGGIGFLTVNKTGGATFTPVNTSQTFTMHGIRAQAGSLMLPQTLNLLLSKTTNGDYFKIDPGAAIIVPANSLVDLKAYQSCSGPTRTIDTNGAFNFENLNLSGVAGCGGNTNLVVAGGTSVTVKKNFSLGATLNSNFNIAVEGSVTTVGAPAGTMAISMVAGGSTTISQATASMVSGLFTVNKPGLTVTASTNLVFNNASQSMNISNGTVDLSGRNLTVNNVLTIGASGKLICNGGTVTAASWTVNGEVSCGTSIGITWTGLAGDHLWSTAGNWTNNTVPGASDIAIFNGMCSGVNCDAQIDSNLSVRGLVLNSTYTGTLTQNATRTLTIGTAGFNQAGGTFAGGDSTMNVNSAFILSGGTFTATSGTWGQWTSFVSSGAPTFNHNSGTFVMNDVVAVTPNGLTFNNVTISGCSSTVTTTGTMIVAGNLNLQAGCGSGVFNGGTYEARGNVVSSNNGAYGTTVILINGAGAQSLSGVTSYLPAININKGGGTLTITGTSRVFGSWTYTAGTVDASASTINFENSNSIVPGSVNYNNINFAGCGGSMNLNTNTMVVIGTVGFAFGCGGGNVNSGTIEARGNIASSNSGSWGTAVVLINGTAAQSMSGVTTWVPAVNINKPSGTLTLSGTIRTASAWTYTAGTVDAGTSNISFESGNSIIPGSIIYYQVSFAGCGGSMNLNAGTMIVSNTLNIGFGCGGGNINNGTIEARGDVTSTNSGGWGTAVILINGTGAQAMSGATTYVPAININKPSGTLTLSGTIREQSGWTYTGGTVDAGTSTIQFDSSNSVIPGAMVFNNITFAGCGGTMNFNAGTLVTTGTITVNYSCGPGDLNNGTIESRGHTIISGSGANGTATFSFKGATSGNFTWTTGSFMTTTVNVLKTGAGSVVLASNIAFSSAGRNLNVTTGTLDLAGYDLTVNNILTVGAAGILKCNGGEFTAGTLTNSGTVNCPGYATYDFNWTGAGGNANWTTAGNWQGGVAPGVSDVVVFQDTYCGATCNSTISINQNAKGVRIFSPFTGTITQNNSAQLFVGARGYTQAAGTFQGGNDSLSVTTKFILTGGVFNSTSGFFGFGGTTWNTASGTFNPGSGIVQIDGPSGGTATINHGTNTFNQLNLYGWAASYTTTGTTTVNGDFNFGTGSGSGTNLTGGIIEAKSNVTVVNNGLGGYSNTTLLKINGTGAQTLTGSGGTMPSLEINKPSGALSMVGSYVVYGPINYVAGTVNPGASTVRLLSANARTYSFNGLTLNDVVFDYSAGSAHTMSLNGQTLNVSGNLTFTSNWAASVLNNGTLNVSGNLIQSGTNSITGSVAVNLVGATDTTITPSGTIIFPGAITINKSGGHKVTQLGNTRLTTAGQNLTIAAGTLDMAGFNLNVANNISNSGTLQRGTNPTCGTITQGGSYSGNAAICP